MGDALGLAIALQWFRVARPAGLQPPLHLASGDNRPDLVPVLPDRLSAPMKDAIDPLVVAEFPHFLVQHMDGRTEVCAEPVFLLDTVQALLHVAEAEPQPGPAIPDTPGLELPPVAACVRPARIVDGGHAAALGVPVLFTLGDEGLYHQMLPLAGGRVYVRECSSRSAMSWVEPTDAICRMEAELTRLY